jgi:hypothetical protein
MFVRYNPEHIAFHIYLPIFTIRKGAKSPSDVTERPTRLYVNFLRVLQTARSRRKPGPRRLTASTPRSNTTIQRKTLRRSTVSKIGGRVVLSEAALCSDPRKDATSKIQASIPEKTDRGRTIYGRLHQERRGQAPNHEICVGAACWDLEQSCPVESGVWFWTRHKI